MYIKHVKLHTLFIHDTLLNHLFIVCTSSGEIIVPTYDWADYLGQYFEKVKSITKYHHFHIDIVAAQ